MGEIKKHNQKKCWLSILVPAYEYAEGVDRIINQIALQNISGVEVIVGDDSKTNHVRNVVLGYIDGRKMININYIKNNGKKGAVGNWNKLINMARGEFILLMHHDEVPLGKDFLNELRSELYAGAGTDALVLGCLIGHQSRPYLRRHIPAGLQAFLLDSVGSTYLLRHNFIGPPSALVIRRIFCPNFDARLNWLVDVDWMNRIFKNEVLRRKISRKLCIASIQRPDNSITSTLINNLKEIECRELSQICAEQRLGFFYILLLTKNSWFGLPTSIDFLLWKTVRILIKAVVMLERIRNPFFHRRVDL